MKRALAPFLVGFVSIQAQTLLLREYLVLFGGSELSIGFLMACWFLWIGLGAMLFAASNNIRKLTTKNIGWLLAAWPFTVLLEVPLLRMAREFMGVAAYEPVPPLSLLIAALMTTLLTSTMTGLLFPAAAAHQEGDQRGSAVRAYWVEGLGAVTGGATVTLMLSLSINLFTQIGILALIAVIFAVIGRFYAHKRFFLTFSGLFFIAGLSLLFAGGRLDTYLARAQLSAGTKGLSFVSRLETPYRVLTLARSGNQKTVLSDGNIVLTWPFTTEDQGIGACLLAQTKGRDFLALGMEGLRLAPITMYNDTRLTVVFPDRTAYRAIADFFGPFGPKLRFVAQDPRVFLAQTRERFDAVLVAGGEPSLLAANRLYSVQAFQLVKRVLRKNGILAVPARIPENFVGQQFKEYGKAILSSLRTVFSNTGIVPGAGGLFVAGEQPMSMAPAEVINRFEERAGTGAGFPPKAFYALLKPERQTFLKQQYQQAAPILNTDNRPMAFYLKLLTLLKAGGDWTSVRILDHFRQRTMPVLLVVLGVLVFMLFLGRFRAGGSRPYGVNFAVGAVGAAGMGMVILLFAGFQAIAGTLFRDVGTAGGAFMLGLVLGAIAMEKLASTAVLRSQVAYSMVAGLVVGVTALLMPHRFSGFARTEFFALFGLTGAVVGGFWPVVSHSFSRQTAAGLETWDHFGAALGALVFGVLILPCLGLRGTGMAAGALVLLAGLSLALDRLHIPRQFHRMRGYLSHQTHPLKSTALVVFGLVLSVLFALPYLKPAEKLRTSLPIEELRNYETFRTAREKEKPFIHYALDGVKNSPGGVIITLSAAIAPDIKGFAGPINLLLSIDKQGIIRKIRVIQSSETPAYVANFPRFLKQFEGRSIDLDFMLDRPDGIDAITGATISSRAATEIINAVDRAVATTLLHHARKNAVKQQKLNFDPETWYVLALIILGLSVHYFSGPWIRLLFLGLVVWVGGFLMNVSLSIPWLQHLARFRFPPLSNLHAFILTAFVLVTTPLLGSLWCAHLCPFGALQELLSRLGARLHLLHNPSPRVEKIMRGTRYVMLLFVILSLYGPNPTQAGAIDPLSTFFSGHLFGAAMGLCIVISFGALFNFRFYCRNLCPVGAFLSALGGLSGLFGLRPARKFGRCDLGVKNHWDNDCLQCNRCIRELREDPK
ncbi:MAG: FMN-binding protein [Deltaproteobacteria bacterium]|nr:FMN-binding protein [Deltaproteobacteria bacterium]